MDLHAPLGKERKGKSRGKARLRLSTVSSVFAVLALSGLSGWTAFSPVALHTEPPIGLTPAPPQASEVAEAEADRDPTEGPAGIATSGPNDGAVIRRTTTADGNVVTTFSPNARQGPVVIGSSPTQDPRLAGQPNEDLIEMTDAGGLPAVSASGLRPVDFYARPWSGARGTRIAIVIGGIGLSQTGSQKAVRELPEDITLAFAATGNSLQRWMQEARSKGHEIVLQVPMEPFDYPAMDPGRGTLLAEKATASNLANLHQAMAQITNYTGIMNYMGARFLADDKAMDPVMRDIGKRGLMFLDDGSTARSLSGDFAKAIGFPHAYADVMIDAQVDRQAILAKLDELERIARRNGQAIGVGAAFDETIAAVAEWRNEAVARGIEFVGVSALANKNRP
ncbi:divergent polysaccharide deacetylase family protein [Rhizobium sp. WL3]|uniref:divergent polysaccharide deacetylase family protein n=1 Tax=Rhizobium sp. WL3 TaxID=2603277 RepID=UPI0011C1DC28|nr:divergent polysaccharide deacetylase family protein [Rhizobium sp. WL3]MBX9470208.1 divergent polysaccharide deacetylase family protein [Rhizobium sp.]QEE45698.1 divergent polysaccharide deacetylase family protein [Rhizobium sp. WL3]